MRNIWSSLLGLSVPASGIDAVKESSASQLQNANHIFNAVHSSMRQWGSSLNHNGMSLFIATVPRGTQLYHGTNQRYRINGTEWLAFEPEHALNFARPHRGPPPGEGGPHGLPPHPSDRHDDEFHPPEHNLGRSRFMPWHEDSPKQGLKARHFHEDRFHHHDGREHQYPGYQKPLDSENEALDDSHGYLHTYRPKRDLRLLYIDGQSAAKSSKGTLDTQDVVLLHSNPPPLSNDHRRPPKDEPNPGKGRGPGGPMNESYRAEHLCAMAENEWQGKIDGILRMELGFEIILCSFERDLDVDRIAETKQDDAGGPPGSHDDNGDGFAYFQAVASRFDGIGGDRVRINYDSIVSLFAFEKAVYFDESGLPRVRNDTSALGPVLDSIQTMIVTEDRNDAVKWQAISDMVVARYSDRIEYLASGDLPDLRSFKLQAEIALKPFIDFGNRNKPSEIQRCATQYLPPPTNSTASAAISAITTKICSTFSNLQETTTLSDALETAQNLKSWLGWTTWKRCRGCGYHEVCFVPIWPMGGAEEREHPRCISSMSDVSRGYWGDFGPPPNK